MAENKKKKIEIREDSPTEVEVGQTIDLSKKVKNPESPKKQIEITEHESDDESGDLAADASENENKTEQPDTDNASPMQELQPDLEGEEKSTIGETAEEIDLDIDKPAEDDSTEEIPSIDEANKLQAAEAEVEADAEPVEQMKQEVEKTIEDAINEAETSPDTFQPDPEIDKAVDEIVRSEGDTALEDIDNRLAASTAGPALSKRQKVKRFFRRWWHNKPARYGTIVAAIVLFGAVVLVPSSRYWVLNTAGVRVQASTTVVDSQTRLPLKNINVQLQGKKATTNEDGYVSFTGLKVGASDLAITKRGYADDKRSITLGWGSNPLKNHELVATGEQYIFVLRDWKSGEPIVDAEATAGENSAKADDKGKITLTIGEDNLSEVEISVDADGYRVEKYKVTDLQAEETVVDLVPARKHVFVSNRDGQFDLYKIDLDGQNEEILLAATEKEREVPAVLAHPTRDLIGYVSSRDGEENKDGFILDGLYLIEVNSGSVERIARSEQLRTIGWSGDKLIFSQVVEGTSAGNSQRSKIISYDERTKERKELATANYFNDVELVGDRLYYAVSSFAVPLSQAKLYSVNVDGSNNETLLETQAWNIFRTEYNKLLISAENQKWYELVDNKITEIGTQPAPTPRRFTNNPSGTMTAWVETRDGKGVMLTADIADYNETVKITAPGLTEVLYWANDDTVVYRVVTSSETADYVVNLASDKEPVKIRDVTASQRHLYY